MANTIRSPYTKFLGPSRWRNTSIRFNLLFVFVPFKINRLLSLCQGSSFSITTGLTARTDILECAQDGQWLFPVLGTSLERTSFCTLDFVLEKAEIILGHFRWYCKTITYFFGGQYLRLLLFIVEQPKDKLRKDRQMFKLFPWIR